MNFLLKTLFLFIFSSLLFSSQKIEKLKDEGFFGAANTVKFAQKIKNIDTRDKLNSVERFFLEGERYWLGSKYSQLNFVSPVPSKVYYFELIDSVIGYMQKTNQLFKAIPYLKKGMNISYEYVFFNKYIEYATVLNDIYLKLGLFNKSWKLLEDVTLTMEELYPYESFEENKDSLETMASHFAQFKLKMDTVITTKNLSLLSYKELKKEFKDLLETYKIHPQLEFFEFKDLTSVNIIKTKDLKEEDLEVNMNYLNIYILQDFLILFSIYEDDEKSKQILHMLNDNYLANIGFKSNAKTMANLAVYAGGIPALFDNTREKVNANYMRFPLQNELWMYANEVKLYLLKNEDKEALLKLKDTQKAFDSLIKNYNQLEPYYKEMDNIDKEVYNFNMLKATVFERNDRWYESQRIYQKLIIKNENIRENIPLNMRKNFFNGLGKNAYLGLIRVNTRIYQNNKTKKNFKNILKAINNIQARQLKELTGGELKHNTSLEEIQNRLDNSSLLYILFDVENAIVIASISKNTVDAKLFVKPKGFDLELLKFKDELVENYQYDFKKMGNISLKLFDLLKEYSNISKLHILSDGIISVLPFDIYLESNGKMLFERYTIDYLSTLEIKIENVLIDNKKRFLGIADPNYENKDGMENLSEYFVRLPETRNEVEKISSLFKNKKILFGNEANEKNIKLMPLNMYSFIHFATHGVLGGELRDVDEPALVLSSNGGEDGFLSTSEVAKLKLNADITVLSACNTGNGKYFRGEGLSGMGRAFKIAGSKNLVVSLWPVDSVATQKLMEKFYENISLGENYTIALYNAKKSLKQSPYAYNNSRRGLKLKSKSNIKNGLDSYSNPYFWSAFIIIR